MILSAERKLIKNIFTVSVGLVFLAVALYLIGDSKISGAEFVALLGLGLLTSIVIKFGDRIESFTFGGNAVKLMHENERAESNIERLDELSSAIADSLTISLPGLYDDTFEKGYRDGVDFVNRYRLFFKLQNKKGFPQEKLELAVRRYLHDTGIGIRYRAMYDEIPDIPSPSQLLKNHTSDNQRLKLAEHKYFRFYETDIYPIYVESRAIELKKDRSH